MPVLPQAMGSILRCPPEAPVPAGVVEEPGVVTLGSGRTVELLELGLLLVAPVVPGSGARQPEKRVAVSKHTIARMPNRFIVFLLLNLVRQ